MRTTDLMHFIPNAHSFFLSNQLNLPLSPLPSSFMKKPFVIIEEKHDWETEKWALCSLRCCLLCAFRKIVSPETQTHLPQWTEDKALGPDKGCEEYMVQCV